MKDQGIGAAVRRKEDFRFLTGVGNYTDDIDRPTQLYAYILLRPHAHAEIADIDTNNTTAPDIVAVFTAADMQVGGPPCGLLVNSKDGSPMAEPPHPVLAQGKVRRVRDPVAVVIAESLAQAKDCAELIQVSYQLLPVVVAADEAIKPHRPQLFDNALSNICFDWHLGDKAAVETAFTGARHVTRLDLPIARTTGNLTQ
jgi:carbon-monoxide dehydrogenase large subunit